MSVTLVIRLTMLVQDRHPFAFEALKEFRLYLESASLDGYLIDKNHLTQVITSDAFNEKLLDIFKAKYDACLDLNICCNNFQNEGLDEIVDVLISHLHWNENDESGDKWNKSDYIANCWKNDSRIIDLAFQSLSNDEGKVDICHLIRFFLILLSPAAMSWITEQDIEKSWSRKVGIRQNITPELLRKSIGNQAPDWFKEDFFNFLVVNHGSILSNFEEIIDILVFIIVQDPSYHVSR